MKGHLIQIDARDGSGAATRYLASADHPSLCHLNGQQWVPAIARLPSLRYDFFGGDFNGAITSPSASFSAAIEGISTFTAMRWAGARVRLYTGNIGDAWGSFTLRFDGRVNAEPTLGEGIANFEAGPDDSWLDKPLLTLFAGSGGVEGPTDLTGVPKPLALGASRFAPGVLVDATNTIYTVSAYAVQGITAAYDRVVSLGGSTGDYASLAALIAAAIPRGSWGTCKALGLVRLGAPADGQVSFDISGDNAGAVGYARKPGAMIRRIAEIAGGTVDTANLTALDTARSYNLALVLTAQTTAREAIQSIADSVCAGAGITWTGTLFAAPLGYTASSQTLKSDGTALPPVASVEIKPVAAPFWRLATEAEPTWVVHDSGNVASEYNLRGLYSATRVYRLDDVVESADGSAWLYINATAGAGNAPPTWPTTSNSYWTTVNPATAASWSLVANDNGAKASDYAGTTNRLVQALTGAGAGTATGNTLLKTGAAGAWDTAWYSAEATRGNGSVAGRATFGAVNIALTIAKVANRATPFSGIGVQLGSGGSINWLLDGSFGASIGSYVASDHITVTFDGTTLYAFKNSVLLGANTGFDASYVTADAIGQFSFFTQNAQLSDAVFTAVGSNNFATTGGATAPEANATIDANIAGNNPVIIFAGTTGAPKTGEIDKVLSYRLFRLGSALTSGVTWGATLISGNATFTISGSGTGTLTVTGPNNSTLAVESVIRLTGSYASVSRTLDVKVIRQDEPPTNAGAGGGNPGTTVTTTSLGNTTGTSFPGVASAMLTAKAGTAGQVACTFPGSYKRTPGTATGETTATGKWQWRVVSGTYADIDAGDTGSNADTVNEPPIINGAGSGAFDATKTGLTSGTEYEFQFIWHRNNVSGTANEVYRSSGTLQAAGS